MANIGPVANAAKYGKHLKKFAAAKKAAKALKRKKQLGQLSDVLGAAAKLTGGGTAHVGSSSNQDYGRAPIPSNNPFDEQNTEDAAGSL